MRSLKPKSTLTPDQIDSLAEAIEADLLRKAMQARPQVKPTDWIVRELQPWVDLRITSAGQANALTDYWGTGALVASTLLVYVNRQLQDNQFVAIYGVEIRDTDPAAIRLLLQSGNAASTFANWGLERLYAYQEPAGFTPEYIYWGGSSTVFVQVLPDAVGKAVGADGVADHITLVGLIAQPAGEVLSV